MHFMVVKKSRKRSGFMIYSVPERQKKDGIT